mgnify:FL=1
MTNTKTTKLGHEIFGELSHEQHDDVKARWEGQAGLLFRAMTSITKDTNGFFEFCTVYPYLDYCANGGEIAKKYWELKLEQC